MSTIDRIEGFGLPAWHIHVGGGAYESEGFGVLWGVNEERISKKRTKNEAKTTKPDTEWKSVEKTKSRQSPSLKKSTQVNPDKSKVKPKATSEEK
ncbi:hypothetical protein Tco_1140262 [Tanacetum coccineum]